LPKITNNEQIFNKRCITATNNQKKTFFNNFDDVNINLYCYNKQQTPLDSVNELINYNLLLNNNINDNK
jgi:hypothetical protein